MKFFNYEDVVADGVKQTFHIRNSDMWYAAVWQELQNHDVSCVTTKDGFVVFTTDPENDHAFNKAEALVMKLAETALTEWKNRKFDGLFQNRLSIRDLANKYPRPVRNLIQYNENREIVNEHLAFIGNVLGKNVKIITLRRGPRANSFGEVIVDADDFYWYVMFNGDVEKGTIKFSRFVENFDPIKDNATNDNIDMEFLVEFNLTGVLSK